MEKLIDGQIKVTEIKEPGKKRHFMQGKFQLKPVGILNILAERAGITLLEVQHEIETIPITINFRDPDPRLPRATRAWEMLKQGMNLREIGNQLGVSESGMTKILSFISKQFEDGKPPNEILKYYRQFRSKPPVDILEVERVCAKFAYQGLDQVKIAEILNLDRRQVSYHIKRWHTKKNLPVPKCTDFRHKLLPVPDDLKS